VLVHHTYFIQKRDAAGKLGLSALQKFLVAFVNWHMAILRMPLMNMSKLARSKEMATQERQSCLSSAIVQFGCLDFFVCSEGLASDGKCILCDTDTLT
jgi:hypothetical protein